MVVCTAMLRRGGCRSMAMARGTWVRQCSVDASSVQPAQCTGMPDMPRTGRIVVLNGATGVGKTTLSIKLAQDIDAEIVSCDSAQVYRGVDIASGKVLPHEMEGVPHYMLDTNTVTQECSAGAYARQAMVHIKDILCRGKTALVVGGSSMYMSFLFGGGSGPTAPPSPRSAPLQSEHNVDVEIDRIFEEMGHDWNLCLSQLAKRDRKYAASLNSNDWKRLRRGLEVCLTESAQGPKALSSHPSRLKSRWVDGPFGHLDLRHFFMSKNRLELFRGVDARCLRIIDQGLCEEAGRLIAEDGLVPTVAAGQVLGYKQLFELRQKWVDSQYLKRRANTENVVEDFVEFVALYQIATRSLVKQQEKWWRPSDELMWYDTDRVPFKEQLKYISIMSRVTREQYEDEVKRNCRHKDNRRLTKEMLMNQKCYIAKLGKMDPVRKEMYHGTRNGQFMAQMVDVHHPDNQHLIECALSCFRALLPTAKMPYTKPQIHRRVSWTR